jgi:RES domain-containing protein
MSSITAWRLSKLRYADTAFEGIGARRFGGRFNSRGVPVAYASSSRALAVLEVIANLGKADEILGEWVFVPITFDAEQVLTKDVDDLPPNWRTATRPPAVQAVGDAWVASEASPVLRVPSAVLPAEPNYLVNPLHPDLDALAIGAPEPFEVDPRLL